MTVKIGMGDSALDLANATVWGNPAQRIMVGLGDTAALAWERGRRPAIFAEFPSGDLLANTGTAGGWFELGGTGSLSARAPHGAYFPEATSMQYTAPEHPTLGGTVMGWFKLSKHLAHSTPLVLSDEALFCSAAQTGNGKLTVAVGTVSAYDEVSYVTYPAAVGDWFHLAISYEQADSGTVQVSVFLNGDKQAVRMVPGTLEVGPTGITIGSGWEGDAGRVRMFNDGPLSDAEVVTIYNSERPIYPESAPLPLLQAFEVAGYEEITIPESTWTTLASATVTGAGIADIYAEWTYRSTGFFLGSHTDSARLTVNGAMIDIWSHSRQATEWAGSGSVNDVPLVPGDVIALEGIVTVGNMNLRRVSRRRFVVTPK